MVTGWAALSWSVLKMVNAAILVAISAIAILVVIIGVVTYMNSVIGHSQNCTDWARNINESKAQLDTQIFPEQSAIDNVNQEVDNFHSQCGY